MSERIFIKSPREIDLMRQAGKLAAGARTVARQAVASGVTTKQIDKYVHEFIVKSGAYPTFLDYSGFPASACVSVNDEIIHGIPGKRVIRDGDIVSLDVGATFKGFVGDCAGTFPCGEISDEAKKLIEVTRQSFFEGIRFAREGYRISDIGAAVQEYVEGHGFSVVRDYVGHGVGHQLHEAPEVPNYRVDRHEHGFGRRPDPRLEKGMTIAVEPMVNVGGYDIRQLDNGWTVVTADGSLSAHYENTILITDGEPEILTMAGDI
ncbi:MAG: type I methionyl aminopeptidase [Oscillospiraceae bacterium]|nr:type I methionyl aminopeptidase [Oscillospiraceae bacterium]